MNYFKEYKILSNMLVNQKANYHLKKESLSFMSSRTFAIPKELATQN